MLFLISTTIWYLSLYHQEKFGPRIFTHDCFCGIFPGERYIVTIRSLPVNYDERENKFLEDPSIEIEYPKSFTDTSKYVYLLISKYNANINGIFYYYYQLDSIYIGCISKRPECSSRRKSSLYLDCEQGLK